MAAELKDSKNVIRLYSALLGRAQLAARLGMQYDNNRDVYQALGYKSSLRYEDYATQYLRQDMAKAIVNRPVQATWRGNILVIQADVKEETEFEKAWKDLWKRFQLKSKFVRLDKMASLGRYGVLLLGLDDIRQPQDWLAPVKQGKRELLYVKPLTEGSAKISSYDNDQRSQRYGLPLIYDVTTSNEGTTSLAVRAHYSRIIHVPGEMLESETDGVPVLQAVFNRLMDLEKLVGASAEMFWRGARPGFKGVVDKDYTMTTETKEGLEEQLDEYENNLRRFLVLEGVNVEALSAQVSDPRYHVDIQLQMIAAVTGIPKRILVGSERGELASSEDKNTWLELIQSRQNDYAEAQIIWPFIDRCMEYGILPQPDSPITIVWPDVFAPSEAERADIGQTRASALQSYMNNPLAPRVVPVQVFLQYMLGLEDEDLAYVEQLYEDESTKKVTDELLDGIDEVEGETPPPRRTKQPPQRKPQT